MDAHKSWHRRGYLPHFDEGAAVQMVTFRLADSLPREFYGRLASLNAVERSQRIDVYVDRGCGSCILSEFANARIVQEALEHFDGLRYRLLAWVIMPNHVHVVIEQTLGHRLGDLVRSWKIYSARRINARRNRHGAVWAADYFDRFIRDSNHLENAIRYIENNPVKAGLARGATDWKFSSAARRAESVRH